MMRRDHYCLMSVWTVRLSLRACASRNRPVAAAVVIAERMAEQRSRYRGEDQPPAPRRPCTLLPPTSVVSFEQSASDTLRAASFTCDSLETYSPQPL
eukprot:383687-Prymnesium_polylepis.1